LGGTCFGNREEAAAADGLGVHGGDVASEGLCVSLLVCCGVVSESDGERTL
jgi:hypothetical protein